MQQTTIPQAESKSVDLINENIEQMKQIFPEVIKEGKVDFEALNDLLGNYTDTPEERFHLNWAGKANARREAQKRSTGTLRPRPEESVDWDTTENLYIEGDNLEVLKLLQKSYHGKVKMIYIDPPYNTGKDFVYKDNYTDNMKNYLELTGQDKKLSTNTESDGRFHSNWLNMMYPRLKLARNLLTADGVIFISIDDNEVANLRKICDEVFGEENFLIQNIWISGRTSSAHFTNAHEYVIGYAKNKSVLELFKYSGDDSEIYDRTIKKPSAKNPVSDISFPAGIDFECEDKIFPNKFGGKEPVEVIEGVLQCENGKLKNSVTLRAAWTMRDMVTNWLDGNEVFDQKGQKVQRFFFKNNGVLQYEKLKGTIHPNSVINGITTKQGSNTIYNLFGISDLFEFPKPTKLIEHFISLSSKDSIILDFFSGSATTAHAVMNLNAETKDVSNRKYICVQIPESTPEDSEARKAGYTTIPEIAKERIRRAGKKILEEQKANTEKEGGLFTNEDEKLDTGFKVFKLDSSNINAWESNPDNLEVSLHNSLFNIKTDRSEDDLLYEILIKYGIELTEKINCHTIADKTVYEMGVGSLIVCLADNLTTDVAEGIGKLFKEVKPDGIEGNCRIVFKDSGFNGSDEVKTNTMLILKQHGILNVASV